MSAAPFRDTIREKNATARATDRLTQFEARRSTHIFSDHDYAVWTGTFAATISDLLAVVENLQNVANHAEELREELGQYRLDEQYEAMATAGAFDEEEPF